MAQLTLEEFSTSPLLTVWEDYNKSKDMRIIEEVKEIKVIKCILDRHDIDALESDALSISCRREEVEIEIFLEKEL